MSDRIEFTQVGQPEDVTVADGFAYFRRQCTPQELLDLIDLLQYALNRHVRDACPGVHRPVQHRDMRPPWCRACGRDALGRQVVTLEK